MVLGSNLTPRLPLLLYIKGDTYNKDNAITPMSDIGPTQSIEQGHPYLIPISEQINSLDSDSNSRPKWNHSGIRIEHHWTPETISKVNVKSLFVPMD